MTIKRIPDILNGRAEHDDWESMDGNPGFKIRKTGQIIGGDAENTPDWHGLLGPDGVVHQSADEPAKTYAERAAGSGDNVIIKP